MGEKDLIEALVIELGKAVNRHCTCGGRGPEDSGACPACLVWHETKDHLQRMIQK